MTDEQLYQKLHALNSKGDLPGMRQVLKESGGMTRVLAIMAKGIGVIETKRAVQAVKVQLTAGFPDAEAKSAAIAYWNLKRRPDLVARAEEIAEQFFNHHYSRNSRFTAWNLVWSTWYKRAVQIEKPPRDMPMASVTELFATTDDAAWLQRLQIFHFGDGDMVEAGYWSQKWGARPGQAGCQIPEKVMIAFEKKKNYWKGAL